MIQAPVDLDAPGEMGRPVKLVDIDADTKKIVDKGNTIEYNYFHLMNNVTKNFWINKYILSTVLKMALTRCFWFFYNFTKL